MGSLSDYLFGHSTQAVLELVCGDESAALAVATGVTTVRMPFDAVLTGVRASVTTAPTGANLIVDINQEGNSILSTKLSIDAGEKTSETAATAAVLWTNFLGNDKEITVDVDQVGSTVAGTGLKIKLYVTRINVSTAYDLVGEPV